MTWIAAFRAALLVSAVFIPGAAVLAEPAAAQNARVNYDLPAQDLAETLRAIARVSGSEIMFAPEEVQGLIAPPVKGQLSPDEAIRTALSGSTLELRYRAGAAIIHKRSAARSVAPIAPQSGPAITVTGTRIRGVGSTSPVTVTTRQELERAGVNNLADFTRYLPQNYAGGQNRGIPGGGEQGGQVNTNDSATLNLRGLGPDATLTLLNGNRLSYDSVNQGVDISAIPLSAIERIEVVADGASALYGSDAVGGVANIILRRDYQGLEASARVGAATDGGDVQQQFSLVAGHRWSSGGVMIALDSDSASPIFAGQRDYARSVDPSLTLTDQIRERSAVISGHEEIARGVVLEADGYVTDRRSLLQNPFVPTEDVHIDGNVLRPHVFSYAIAPKLRMDLGKWQASVGLTGSGSRTLLDVNIYSQGVPFHEHILDADGLKGAEINAEGPLLLLPGGDARLAVGGGAREISFHQRIVQLSTTPSSVTTDYTQRRNVQYAYGELSLPLIGESMAFPLVHKLILTGALRYERWKTIAAVTTPKIGMIYQPSDAITVRATWGKSFKIPTLRQVNDIEEGDLIPGFYFTPPPQPAGSPVLLLEGSAPNLKPERAITWSGTLEAKPSFVPGLDLTATYFNIDYRDRIAPPLPSVLSVLFNPLYKDFVVYNPSASEVYAVIAALPGGLVNQTGAPFDASGVGAIIDAAMRNTERQRIRGVDLNADYRVDLGAAGKLLVTGAASYLKSNQQLAPNLPTLQLAGTVFHPPHWRGHAGVTWERAHVGMSVFVNYAGPTVNNLFATASRIGSFVTFDASAAVRTTARQGPLHDVELQLSALNLLNQKPHFLSSPFPEAAPYDSTNESPVGRFLGATIRKRW